MNETTRKSLEAAGWHAGDAGDFLGLSKPEMDLIDLRLSVGQAVRRVRLERGLTQRQLAERLGTRQPRVARIEAVEVDVSLDQLFHALYAAGGTLADIRPVARVTPPGPEPNGNGSSPPTRPKRAARAAAAKSRR